MLQKKQYIDFKNEHQYWVIAQNLENKIATNEKLSYREIGFFCSGQKFQFLRRRQICDDEFFSRSYLELNPPAGITDDPNLKIISERYGNEVAPLTEDDKIYYRSLVNQWDAVIAKENHKDQLLLFYCTETRKEIRDLKRSLNKAGVLDTSSNFIGRKFKILEFSKYRYIVTNAILEIIIQNDHYKLFLNGTEIRFNAYSLSHIITRHYGLPMKVYETDKSHFSEVIHYEDIHKQLELVFTKIDETGLYINDSVREINFKLNDIIYRVYCEKVQEGGQKIYRINSFFPLQDVQKIRELNLTYEEEIIDRYFSLYIKKK